MRVSLPNFLCMFSRMLSFALFQTSGMALGGLREVGLLQPAKHNGREAVLRMRLRKFIQV